MSFNALIASYTTQDIQPEESSQFSSATAEGSLLEGAGLDCSLVSEDGVLSLGYKQLTFLPHNVRMNKNCECGQFWCPMTSTSLFLSEMAGCTGAWAVGSTVFKASDRGIASTWE
jgi:hypothetical protein